MKRREFIALLGSVTAGLLNLKTARALGVAIPQTLLVQADEVIE